MTERSDPKLVVVRGAGEMASGVIKHLVEAGCRVIALEQPKPTCVRRYVCFAEACYDSEVVVDDITATLAQSLEEALRTAEGTCVSLLIDPDGESLSALEPSAVIDARMFKKHVDYDLDAVPALIGLGPGFVAGTNCHAAIETNRGDDLGRVHYTGSPSEYTGIPSSVGGHTVERVLRSPCDGVFNSCSQITDRVVVGQVLGQVSDVSIKTKIGGIVRGLIRDGRRVSGGQKLGDVDPRGIKEKCLKISGKANTIGKGALKALLELEKSKQCNA